MFFAFLGIFSFLNFPITATVSESVWGGGPPDAGSQVAANDCWWGKKGEITTYNGPYCEMFAPEIPVERKAPDTHLTDPRRPMRPEDAITVVGSDGSRYSYYFREVVGYQKKSEFRNVFEPIREIRPRQVEMIDPVSGAFCTMTVSEPFETPYPVWHEKEFVRYEPVKMLQKIIFPGLPPTPDADGIQRAGSAATHLSAEISPED